LPGWTIQLETSYGLFTTTVTGPNGAYTFTNLPGGTFTVTELLLPGWTQSYPPPPGNYSVGANEPGTGILGLAFGNWQPPLGEVHGLKWNDLDGDGSQDDGEPGLANWQIQLQGDNGIFSSTLTGSQGNYWFMNLPPGNYTVTEVLQSDWQQTWPEDGHYAFLLSPGLIVENANFGNWSSYAVYLPAILKQ
jgi:hypothetical protein